MSRKMKDSGDQWVGTIPADWDILEMKKKMSFINGYAFDSQDLYSNGLNPVIRIGDFQNNTVNFSDANKCNLNNEELSKYTIIEKDILIAMSGATVGKIAYIDKIEEKAYINQRVGIIRSHDSRFLYYLLNIEGFKEYINLLAGGTAQPNISTINIKNYKIAFPNSESRERIIKVLDRKIPVLEFIIKKTQSTIEEYKFLKKSIIAEAVTKGIDKNVEMKDSEIKWVGIMPAHWYVLRGKVILQKLSRPVLEDDEIITCFRDGEVTLRTNRRENGFTMADKEIGYQGLEVGDLVIHGMDGFAGAIGISDSRGKGSPVLNVLDSNQNKEFVMFFLRSMAVSDVFLALAKGIRVRSCDLRWSTIGDLPYPIPPIDEQKRIVSHIKNRLRKIDKLIESKSQLLKQLEEYKKSLIFEYVTGKREVL